MKSPQLTQYRSGTVSRNHRPGISILLSLAVMLCTAFSPRASYALGSGWPLPFRFPTSIAVGTGSTIRTVPVAIQTGGTVATVSVLTQGAPAGDFIAVAGATCSPGTSFSAGDTCDISIQFQPRAPGARQGAIVLLDAGRHVLGTTLLYGTGIGPVGVFLPATINTVAGNGAWVFRGDGGPAIDAPIFLPGGMAADGAGNVFISDSSNNRIRRVDAVSGIISTVAGTGSPGSEGDNGVATAASVNTPTGMAVDGAGDILFADSANHVIRRLELATGILSTIAGRLGQPGFAGDGGQSSLALLNTPESVAFDLQGNLFISDTGNHVVRKIDAITGVISTVAGTGKSGFSGDGGIGTAAALNTPWGIATDASGNLYIADLSNQRIRKLDTTGLITTVVGTGIGTYNGDGEPATSANVKDPAAVAVDVAGNLYVADSGNNLIRKVSSATGFISTIAGDGTPAFSGDRGPSTLAGIYGPYALALDSNGNLLLSDIFHHRIREIFSTQASLTYPAIRVGRTSASKAQIFENGGNDALSFTGLTPDNNSALDLGTTTCSSARPLASSAMCTVGAEFSPQGTGNPVTATIALHSNAANSAAVLTLSGEVDALEPTTTVLTSSKTPAAVGSVVTFTAVVSGAGAAPSGNVRFFDGATLIGTSATTSGSTATFQTSSLNLGSHTITAAFTGDATNSPGKSLPLIEIIRQTPVVSLASSQASANVGNSVTFTATVTAPSLPPTGTLTFADGSVVLGSGTLDANGVATFTTSSLPSGTHSLIASYLGDTNTLASTSPALAEIINPWPTAVTLTSNLGNAIVGTPLTFSMAATTTSSVTPTGSVTLFDGPTLLVTLSLDGSGHAAFTFSDLAVGTHSLNATFSGDTTNAASKSMPLAEIVQQAGTSTALASSANPATAGAILRLTAIVSASSETSTAGAVSGSVTFNDGATALGTAAISSAGVATLDFSSLGVGPHSLTAIYTGNTNYATSTSPALPEAVQLANTTVQLNSSAISSIAGSGITLTAVVSGTGSLPTGTVTFLDGTAALGTSTVNATGQASLSISTLSAGPHAITASYRGDAKNNTGVSSPLAQIVSQASTSIVLTSSANPSIAGLPLTFVASLASNGSLPQGQITLSDGSTPLAVGTLSMTGAVSFNIAALGAGSHALTATFPGDADHTASSFSLAQTVQQGTSTITLLSSRNPSLSGESVVFSARITGSGNQPRGEVNLLDGSTPLATLTLDATGNASFALSTLSIGDHPITATFLGDLTHTAALPAVLVQRVQQPTITALASTANPALVGAALQLTATVAGVNGAAITGTVSFADGAAVLGVSPVDAAGVASLPVSTLSAGTHLIVATYSGDRQSRTSLSSALQQSVNSAGTTVTVVSSANPAIVGSAVTFTANVASVGDAPSGTVQFLDGSTPLGASSVKNGTATLTTSTLVAGQHAIIARYGGDTGTQVSTSGILVQIAQQTTSLTVISSANPILTAQALVLTADLHNGSRATGFVVFLDGATPLGSVTLDANGTASLALPSLASGTHSIAASYSGDTLNLPSTSAILSQSVQLRTTSASMAASSDTYLSGKPVTLVAVIHSLGPLPPTGTVTFTSGADTLGSAPLSTSGAATLTFFPLASAYKIAATYTGDPVYAGSSSDAYAIASGPSTTFTMTANATALTLTSGSHTTIDLTLTSVKDFSDILALGCLELPADATCTFSQDRPALAKNGTTIVHLTVDTGNPLGSGAHAQRSANPPAVFDAGLLLPSSLVLGALLAFARRRRPIPALLPLALLLLTGFAVTGCGTSLTTSDTPAGSYTVRIMASGTASGAAQTIDLPLKVN